jgi:hypothetical protein
MEQIPLYQQNRLKFIGSAFFLKHNQLQKHHSGEGFRHAPDPVTALRSHTSPGFQVGKPGRVEL